MTKVIRPNAMLGASLNAKTPDTTKPLAAGALTENEAGGVAYTSSDREAVLSYLMTGGFGSTFYVDAATHAKRARDLFARAAQTDTEYLAKAAVYARTKGYMRSMPILALSYLSLAPEKKYFQSAFGYIIVTPGDLADFMALTRGEDRVRGSSRTVRRTVGAWLDTLTPYHVIKYGSENQKMSLRDIYRLAHPQLTTAEAKAIATYVVKGTVSTDLPAQLKGYVDFKGASDTVENLLSMVAEHRLPWEVVTGQLGGGDSAEKTLVWTEMSKQMPYMAMLRNLNNFAKNGVLDNGAERKRILNTISDPERVKTGKQFPFRYISAIRAFEAADNNTSADMKYQVTGALRSALNTSVSNMPNLGKTLVALDVSGSMSSATIGGGNRYSKPGSVSAADIGSVFAAAVYLGSENPTIMTFDTSVLDVTPMLNKDMDVYSIARSINRQGGGTSLSEPITAALTRAERYDTMLFITDSESWADAMSTKPNTWSYFGGQGTKLNALLNEYRAKFNSNLKVFFLQLIPNTTQQTEQDTPNTFYIHGWSEDVLRYMSFKASENQLNAVLGTTLTGI